SFLYLTDLGGSGSDQVNLLNVGNNSTSSGMPLAIDGAGALYLTGRTSSINFPVKDAVQPSNAGGNSDAFVTKIDLNRTGPAQLAYSTYLGGNGEDAGTAIAVDSFGTAYVVGRTSSANWPTLGAYQDRLNGT